MEAGTFVFVAKAANGQHFRIYGERERIPAGTLSDPNTTIAGMTRLEMEDGTPVTRLEKGRYEVVGLGIVTSDDPNAP